MAAPDTVALVSFETPPEPPRRGAGLQRFRALVRRSSFASADIPLVTLKLYENGAPLATLLTSEPVTSDTGQLVAGVWDAVLLTNVNGSGVEVRIEGTHTGERTVEVGAVEWQFVGAMVTQLGLVGSSAPYRLIPNKEDQTPGFVTKAGSDTLLISVTETPNDPIAVETTDTVRPVMNETRALMQVLPFSTDTLVLRITESTPGPVQSTPTLITASDSIVPVLVESVSLVTVVSATDSLVPVVSDSSVLVTDSLDVVTASDTLVLVLNEGFTLEPFIGLVEKEATDDLVPVITETAARRDYFDVDRITISARPYGRITITPV